MTKTYNIRISGELVDTITVEVGPNNDGAELAAEEFLDAHPELEPQFATHGHVTEAL